MFNLIDTDCFVITEFSYSIMYILLEQIYTGYKAELPADSLIQLEVLKAAGKYKLEPLIKKIEKVPCRQSW
ncbi:MAG: BTB/POZ domain-containing protein [Candidatus Pacebacteria bacterium]|nr:BTB/POZ domain-containing protein [Candidatus Paceibacterota bacterium]